MAWSSWPTATRNVWRKTPRCVQANKRDLPDALPLETLRHAFGVSPEFPLLEAQAVHGIGVRETFMTIVRLVLSVAPS